MEIFPGNYEDYLWRIQGGARQVASIIQSQSENKIPERRLDPSPVAKNGILSETQPSAEPKQRRVNPIKLRQMKERVHEIEEEITKLEAGIVECEQALQSFVSAQETARITSLLENRRSDLESLMNEWEEVSAVIEST